MAASHMWYDGMTLDISTNYEENLNLGKPIEYDINEPGFKTLL